MKKWRGKIQKMFKGDKRRSTIIIFVILFTLVGAFILIRTLAATSRVAVESENGTVASPATIQTDSNASGGKFLKFGGGIIGSGGFNNGLRMGISTGYPYVKDKDFPDRFSMSYTSYVNKIASLGMHWIRTDAIINGTQPLTVLDETMTALKAKSMKILVAFTYGDLENPSAALSKMTAYIDHWKSLGLDSTIGGYEMGNEPNNGGDPRFGLKDPAKLAAWMKLSYPVLKLKTPSAVIMPGGFAPGGGNAPCCNGNLGNPADYLNALYSHNGGTSKNMFDAVAHHPYANSVTSNYPEGNTPVSGLRATHYVRQVMDIHGDQAKQIWATEGGWESCGTNQWTEAQRNVRMINDLNDWFHGTHDSSGKRTGYSLNGDWNAGVFMIFKLYKAGTGGTDDDNGLIYTDVQKCGGKAANYEPPVIDGIKLYSAIKTSAIPTGIAQ